MSGPAPSTPLKYRMAGSKPDMSVPPVIPKAAAPAPKPAIKQSAKFGETLFRVAIVTVILASTALAYWSFFHRLLPLQKQARNMVNMASASASSLDELERRWTPRQTRETREQYREIYTQLFPDQAALEQWIAEVRAQAAPLSLNIDVTFGNGVTVPGFTNNLAMIPTSLAINVEPVPGQPDAKSPYQRLLLLTERLASLGKRADLAELNVTSGQNSVSHAVMVFNLWAGDLGAEAGAEPVKNNQPAR